MDIITGLITTIPLSILARHYSAKQFSLNENKKEFMIYESTISDILGIIAPCCFVNGWGGL